MPVIIHPAARRAARPAFSQGGNELPPPQPALPVRCRLIIVLRGRSGVGAPAASRRTVLMRTDLRGDRSFSGVMVPMPLVAPARKKVKAGVSPAMRSPGASASCIRSHRPSVAGFRQVQTMTRPNSRSRHGFGPAKGRCPREGGFGIQGLCRHRHLSLGLFHCGRLSEGHNSGGAGCSVRAIRFRGGQGADFCEIHSFRTRPPARRAVQDAAAVLAGSVQIAGVPRAFDRPELCRSASASCITGQFRKLSPA